MNMSSTVFLDTKVRMCSVYVENENSTRIELKNGKGRGFMVKITNWEYRKILKIKFEF